MPQVGEQSLLLRSIALACSNFVQLAWLHATQPGLIIKSGVSPAQTDNRFYANTKHNPDLRSLFQTFGSGTSAAVPKIA